MSKSGKSNGGSDTIETISAAATEQKQMQLQIDDANAPVTYSSTVRVWGSAEEVILDFAGPLRPAGPSAAKLKVDQRIILNPWTAKRLAMQMGQAVARYEQTYGALEIDPRKRMVSQPAGGGAAATAPAAGKLS